METEYYKSGKQQTVWKPKPKFTLNPRWRGELISREELERLYLKEHRGIRTISKKLGLNYKVIKARLMFYEIPIRSYQEALQYREYPNGHPKKRKTTAKEITSLILSGLTKDEIAKVLRVCDKTIYMTLKRENSYEQVEVMIKINAIKKNIKPHGYWSQELRHRVRSKWEEQVGKILRQNEIQYEYEPLLLPLTDTYYLPDFKIGRIFLEVKGYPAGLETLKEAVNNYPEYEFWLIHQTAQLNDLASLCQQAFPLFGHHGEIIAEVKQKLIANLKEKHGN